MREQLRTRLAEVWPELQILAEARNGEEAVAAVNEHRPDLAFLDIRMPGMTGIEAARAIGDACHIVFITAYNEYAVDAFEHGAVDYVLKPAERERLEVTVARLKKRLGTRPSDLGELLAKLSATLDGVGAGSGKAPLQWIQASVGQQLRMIPVGDVLFFTSDEKYTRVADRRLRGADPQADQGIGGGARSRAVLADPPVHDRQRQGDRRHHPGLPGPPAGAREGQQRETRGEPQLHSPLQADVSWRAFGRERALTSS